MLGTQMQERIIPALKQSPGKGLHVTARFIAIFAFRTPSGMARRGQMHGKPASPDSPKESGG